MVGMVFASLMGMGNIKIELEPAEVKALAMMAENEFLRMRFINPRLPGYAIDANVLRAAQSATARLSEIMKRQRGFVVGPEELRKARAESN